MGGDYEIHSPIITHESSLAARRSPLAARSLTVDGEEPSDLLLPPSRASVVLRGHREALGRSGADLCTARVDALMLRPRLSGGAEGTGRELRSGVVQPSPRTAIPPVGRWV